MIQLVHEQFLTKCLVALITPGMTVGVVIDGPHGSDSALKQNLATNQEVMIATTAHSNALIMYLRAEQAHVHQMTAATVDAAVNIFHFHNGDYGLKVA